MAIPFNNGTGGTSGTSGCIIYAGSSGTSGTSGTDGINGSSGTSGISGSAGTSGSSGTSGVNGSSGQTGSAGTSGTSGVNGSSGTSGLNGVNGTSGVNGLNGTSGTSGSSGTSGTSGATGSAGTSGSSGVNGSSGTSGLDAIGLSSKSGNVAFADFTETSPGSGIYEYQVNFVGNFNNDQYSITFGAIDSDPLSTDAWNPVAGDKLNTGFKIFTGPLSADITFSWLAVAVGETAISGTSGSSGTSGVDGQTGTAGTSGTSGIDGSSGTSGLNGVDGTSGVNGTSGTSGISGSGGTSGTSGTSGTNGAAGISSGQVYYFNQSQASDVSPYRVLATTPNGAQQIVPVNLAGSQQGVLVSRFLTPQLGFGVIPGGNQRFYFHYLKQAVNDHIQAYATLELADAAGNSISPALPAGSAEIGWVDASTPVEVAIDLTLSTTTIDPTNRVIVKIYISNNDSTAHIVNWYTEGTQYYSFVVTTVGAIAGTSGTSGTNGSSGVSGTSGTSGISGSSGTSGISGSSGTSGTSGVSPIGTITSSGPTSISFVWSGTQAQYTALGTYDASTIYFIE